MAYQPAIELEAVSVGYQARKAVLRDFSLQVEPGQLVAVLGTSGSGKSTLLRTIAGLLLPFTGQVSLCGHRVETLPPKARSIGFVFQSLALFPNMTVAGNVQFAAEHANASKRHAVGELLSRLGLTALSDKFPHQLSGGQAQRVALARALAGSPATLLLDEPFSSLDRPLADSARELVTQLHTERRLTTILVTHDREQAMLIADRIIVLGTKGTLLQDGPPSEVYDCPASADVASLTGAVSLISGVVSAVIGNTVQVSTAGGGLSAQWRHAAVPVVGAPVRVAVRPEWISVQEEDRLAESQLVVGVNRAVNLSGRVFLHCSVGGAFLLIENHRVPPPSLGAALTITLNKAIAFPMENGDVRENL